MSGEAESTTRDSHDQRRPPLSYLRLAGLMFLGIGAIYGGVSFILDPTGGTLGVPVEWIQDSAFGTYLIPGIFLLVVIGLGSFTITFDIVRLRVRAWTVGIAVETITVLWVVIQYGALQQYIFLQPVIAGVGITIIVLLVIPSMRRYYRADVALGRLGIVRR